MNNPEILPIDKIKEQEMVPNEFYRVVAILMRFWNSTDLPNVATTPRP